MVKVSEQFLSQRLVPDVGAEHAETDKRRQHNCRGHGQKRRRGPAPLRHRDYVVGLDVGQFGNFQPGHVQRQRLGDRLVEFQHVLAIRLACGALTQVPGAAVE